MKSILNIKRALFLFFIVLGPILTVQSSSAATDSTLSELRVSMNLTGSHRFVYRMFFKLYDACFYTDAEQVTDIDRLLNGENALLLEFDYLRTIKKSIILESSEKILAKNMSPTELTAIQERVNQINAVYQTVGKGDRSALSYVPGKGTTLWINDQAVITIEGKDFAQLYFRIWLGEQPISQQMRDALLQRITAKG